MPHSKYTGLVLDVARQRGGAEPGTVTLLDHSRYGNDGTMANVTWVQLPSGLWVQSFNGASSEVNFGDVLDIRLGDMTLEAWVNVVAPTQDNYSPIFAKAVRLDGGTIGYGFYFMGGENNINVRLGDGIAASVRLNFGYTNYNGIWTHALATFDRDGDEILYLNGVDVMSAALGGVNTDINVTQDLLSGSLVWTTPWLDGQITLARIYNYALTPAQIRSRYSATRRLFGV